MHNVGISRYARSLARSLALAPSFYSITAFSARVLSLAGVLLSLSLSLSI